MALNSQLPDDYSDARVILADNAQLTVGVRPASASDTIPNFGAAFIGIEAGKGVVINGQLFGSSAPNDRLLEIRAYPNFYSVEGRVYFPTQPTLFTTYEVAEGFIGGVIYF